MIEWLCIFSMAFTAIVLTCALFAFLITRLARRWKDNPPYTTPPRRVPTVRTDDEWPHQWPENPKDKPAQDPLLRLLNVLITGGVVALILILTTQEVSFGQSDIGFALVVFGLVLACILFRRRRKAKPRPKH